MIQLVFNIPGRFLTKSERVADCFLYIHLPSLHGSDVQFPYDRRTYSPTLFPGTFKLGFGPQGNVNTWCPAGHNMGLYSHL